MRRRYSAVDDEVKLALLRQVEFFRGLDVGDLELVAQRMTDQFYENGDVVVREGDPGDQMFLLITGTVHVYVERDDQIITYTRLQSGECFGEMALIEDAPRSATVQAEEPSLCLALSNSDFLELLNRHPHISLGIMKGLSSRLRRTNIQVQNYASQLASIPDTRPVVMNFKGYETGGFYDEMLEADGSSRGGAALLAERIEALPQGELQEHRRASERALLQLGITFNVYGNESGTERVWQFDIIPRIVESSEWAYIERGLKQRIHALNLFINDIYHKQSIVKDSIVPEHMIRTAQNLLEPCMGLNPPRGIWCHITGTDVVRDSDGANLYPRRQPSVPFWRLLRAGKPAGAEAHFPPGLRSVPGTSCR